MIPNTSTPSENNSSRDFKLIMVQLTEIWHRMSSLAGALTEKNMHAFTTQIVVDFIMIEYRKILESIAFVGVINHMDEIRIKIESMHHANASKKQIKKMELGNWHATALLKTLEEVNPDFYPVPLKGNPPEIQIDERDHLTKDNFIELYELTNEFLHQMRPFQNEGRTELTTEYLMGFFRKIDSLMNHHLLKLTNGNFFVVKLYYNESEIRNAIHLIEFAPID